MEKLEIEHRKLVKEKYKPEAHSSIKRKKLENHQKYQLKENVEKGLDSEFDRTNTAKLFLKF